MEATATPEARPQPAAHPALLAQYENMLSCIRCGLCLSACPTYQISFHEAESPRGRIAMARAFTEGHLALTPDLVEHQSNCLLCEACTAICPAGVEMEAIAAAFREMQVERRPPGLFGRIARRATLGWAFMSLGRLRFAFSLLWLYQRTPARWLARHTGALWLLRLRGAERLAPEVHRPFFVPEGQVAGEGLDRRVAMLAGCVMSTAGAATDRATVRVLNAFGAAVSLPKGQGCCGALHLHTGDMERARELARRTIDAFEDDPAEAIVVNAAGCGSAMKGYGHWLADDPAYAERARAFSARVRDLSEYLVSLPGEPPPAREVRATAVYQEACHLAHAQRIRLQPKALLKRIPGLQVREMAEPAMCCGSAGVYNLLRPEKASALSERKVNNIAAASPERVISANPGCILQMRAGLARDGRAVAVQHIADLLDEAYGGGGAASREVEAGATGAGAMNRAPTSIDGGHPS